jgi:hypothetical protein
MIKITKRYKIAFSYAGYTQYAEFNEVDGVLYNPTLNVSYSKSTEIPDVSKCKTIDEVLGLIKKFAYGGQAKIDRINGMPPFYYKNIKTQKLLKDMREAHETFIEEQANIFFNTTLKPILKKNKWKISKSHIGMMILIAKDENGEWDNVRDEKKEFEFEYLCKCFLSAIGENTDRFSTGRYLSILTDLDDFYLEV